VPAAAADVAVKPDPVGAVVARQLPQAAADAVFARGKAEAGEISAAGDGEPSVEPGFRRPVALAGDPDPGHGFAPIRKPLTLRNIVGRQYKVLHRGLDQGLRRRAARLRRNYDITCGRTREDNRKLQ
jgi:hypothetical protein